MGAPHQFAEDKNTERCDMDLVQILSTFFSCPHTFQEPEIKSSELNNLVEEISK